MLLQQVQKGGVALFRITSVEGEPQEFLSQAGHRPAEEVSADTMDAMVANFIAEIQAAVASKRRPLKRKWECMEPETMKEIVSLCFTPESKVTRKASNLNTPPWSA